MHLRSADIYYKAFRPCFGLISGVSNTGRLCLPFSVLVLRGKCTVRVQSHLPQSPVKVISRLSAQNRLSLVRNPGELYQADEKIIPLLGLSRKQADSKKSLT